MIFQKRRLEKDFIDSSIFLDSLIDRDKACEEYFNKLGYRARNIGFVCNLVFGELLKNIALRMETANLRREVFEALIGIIDEARYQERLIVLYFRKKDLELAIELLEDIEHMAQPSDALLLAIATRNGCDNFVTIDEKLWKVRKRIVKEYMIKIKKP